MFPLVVKLMLQKRHLKGLSPEKDKYIQFIVNSFKTCYKTRMSNRHGVAGFQFLLLQAKKTR